LLFPIPSRFQAFHFVEVAVEAIPWGCTAAAPLVNYRVSVRPTAWRRLELQKASGELNQGSLS
jgi:hypothetical protein